MAYLADAEVASFNELKAVLKVTQGNHSIQLHKLEDGASRALRRIPAIVSFLNPQPALILVCGNRSSRSGRRQTERQRPGRVGSRPSVKQSRSDGTEVGGMRCRVACS